MVSTPKGSNTPKSTPPLKPTKPSRTSSPKVNPLDAHRRSVSAPAVKPPFISIEDATQALTVAESSHTGTPPVRQDTDGSSSTAGSSPEEPRRGTAGSIDPDRRRSSAWRHYKRSPNVGWKKRWDEHHNAFRDGRVLVVDCYSREFSDDGKRKTAAYEFADINELQDFYGSKKGRGDGQCLRIVHVQNAVWARDFLLKKFNISSKVEDVVGTAFGRWVRFDKPELRAGKPVLNAKSFRCIKDPWRGVSRTGFVVDYLKSFRHGVIKEYSDTATRGFKLMDLNHWDQETGTTPVHGFDVYVQRLSVYIQHNEGKINLHPLDTELRNPYIDLAYESRQQKARRKASVHLSEEDESAPNADPSHDDIKPGIPKTGSMPVPSDWEGKVFEKLTELDNGNTIIVFESSHTGKPSDTMIQAREEIEVRWRRIMLYLGREEQSEDRLAMECMDLVLRDIFKGLQIRWEKTMNKCEAHVNILEDKVYENPADESRAPELWSNSAMWLKLEKLISLHTNTITDLQQQMRDLSEGEDFIKEDWLKDTPADLDRIAKLFDEEMVKPTANLSDLLYKSVGIRDSRHSLQLGSSMWRLSWITFIFLPLTFMVGFFGMNVDTFQPPDGHFPSIKWYFVASIPLMLLIIVLYMFIKSTLSTSHEIPLQRGIYEQIYNQFAADHPELWSRVGPRSYVKPRGYLGKLKWRIVKNWFNPKRTIARKTYTEIDEMGLWARIKRSLAQRWLAQIEASPGSGIDEERGDGTDVEFSTISELLEMSMPVAMADAWPGVADAPATPPLRDLIIPRRSRSSSGSRSQLGRVGSPASEMVVEEEKSDDESSKKVNEKRKPKKEAKTVTIDDPPASDAATAPRPERSTSDQSHFSTGFLNVPFNLRRSEEHFPE